MSSSEHAQIDGNFSTTFVGIIDRNIALLKTRSILKNSKIIGWITADPLHFDSNCLSKIFHINWESILYESFCMNIGNYEYEVRTQRIFCTQE